MRSTQPTKKCFYLDMVFDGMWFCLLGFTVCFWDVMCWSRMIFHLVFVVLFYPFNPTYEEVFLF